MGKDKLFQKRAIIKKLKQIDKSFPENNLLFSEHHLSHAASAFFPSPFEEAAIITLDGVGEWSTSTISIGSQNNIKIIKEINYGIINHLLEFQYLHPSFINFSENNLIIKQDIPMHMGTLRFNDEWRDEKKRRFIEVD